MPRPLSFDPHEKLRQAMFIFWKDGYASTSINDLCDQLSLNKFSIYKQFGNKNTLYQQSLRHYHDTIFVKLLLPLDGRSGLTSVLRYFDNFSEHLSKPEGQLGCLINNTLLAGNLIPEESRASAKTMVGALRDRLKLNFEIASQQGEIDQSAQDCLNFTLMNIQALLNTRKTMGSFVMQRNLKFLTRQMRHW